MISKAMTSTQAEIDWEDVYRAEYPRVYNYFRFRTGDPTHAEDLTAETFERAWRGRHRYRHDQGAFAAWLFGIARKVAAKFYRQQRRASRQQSLSDTIPDVGTQDAHDGRGTEAAVQKQLNAARLNALLTELNDRERELIALKYGAQFNNRQIARISGLSESNVGTILHRTVQSLRQQWEDANDE